MKFNFENLKKVGKVIGAVGAGTLPNHTSDNVRQISHEDLNPPSISQSVSIEKPINPETTVNFQFTSNESKESIDPIIDTISKFEKSFEDASSDKGPVDHKGIVIISEAELNQERSDPSSKLGNNYYSDVVVDDIVNSMKDVNVYERNLSMIQTIDTDHQFTKEHKLKVPQYKIGYTKPAYYFVIDENNTNKDSVKFNIKLVSLENKTIENIGLIENVENDRSIIESKMVKIIEDKIKDLNLGEKIN